LKITRLEEVMPIYAYGCSSCGMQKDVMQKMSDAPLSTCPACGKETLTKQLTAAGFQLKGSGYYVTDFKGGPKKPNENPEAKPESKLDAAPAPATVPAVSVASSPVASGTA
jgi:putative FmdB family regulatory protein